MNKFIHQAQQLRASSGKPICLISAIHIQSNAFDVQIHPQQSLTLPYANKHFSALVGDSLEEIPNPSAALTEWQRVADKVFVNTHFFFSPEAWLDLKHRHVFMGKQMIDIQPPVNWGILGGLGYYFFYVRPNKKKKGKTELPMLPPPSLSLNTNKTDKVEEAPLIEPSKVKNPLEGRLLDIGGALEFEGDKMVLDPNLPEEHNQQVLAELEITPADLVVISKFDELPDDEKEATIQIASENLKKGGKAYIPTKTPNTSLGKVRKFFRRAKKQQGYIEAEG